LTVGRFQGVQLAANPLMPSEHFKHFASATKVITVTAPGTYNHVRVISSRDNHFIVIWSDWIGLPLHVLGVSRAIGEKVSYHQPAEPQHLGPSLASLYGRIVLLFRGSRWIEHYEVDLRRNAPFSQQDVSVLLARAISRTAKRQD